MVVLGKSQDFALDTLNKIAAAIVHRADLRLACVGTIGTKCMEISIEKIEKTSRKLYER